MIKCLTNIQTCLNRISRLEFLALLAIRLYLVPVLWVAGTNKLMNIENTAAWFEHSLHMPLPTLMVYLAAITETFGAIALLIGFATRWFSIPLIIVMIVAALTVHFDHGWLAIANESAAASQRLAEIMQWLQNSFPAKHGYLTELGQPVILNNGVEFAVTYTIMLLVLLTRGAGRYLSVDYWLQRQFLTR